MKLELALRYALEYESVLSPVDFFLRRTEILLFSSENIDHWKNDVVDYMARYLEWSEKEKENYLKQLEEAISHIQLKNLRK